MPLDLTPEIQRAQADPEWFLTHILGWRPTRAARVHGYTAGITPDQQRIVRAVRDYPRVGVRAGHGVGKTKIAAGLAVWFLFCFPHSKVITTAPTAHQVEHLLWREIRTVYAASKVPLGGRLLTTELEIAPDWFALGLSPARDKEEETAVRFQGFHAPRMLVIFDEAVGVHPAIWSAASGLVVGAHDKWLVIGNPTDPTSAFKAAEDSGLWHILEVSALTHPNVLHTDPAIVPGAVTQQWITTSLEDYGGSDTPLARAKIYGKWPEQGSDALISLAWVEAAQSRYIVPLGSPQVVGCDVARFGTDATIIYGITDGMPALCHRAIGQNLMATVGALQVTGAPLVLVDDTGVGGGVTDRLNERKKDADAPWRGQVVACNFGSAAPDPEKFVNLRSALWWVLREELRAGRLALPPDPRLAADLSTVRFSYDSKARIVLESKDLHKRRLGRSPDQGDALALACWGWTGQHARGPKRLSQLEGMIAAQHAAEMVA